MNSLQRVFKNIGSDLKKYYKGLLALLIYVLITQCVFGTVCIFAIATGLPCPGCGITRATLFIMQFKFIEAFEMNLFAYPCICVIVYIMIRRYVFEKKKLPMVPILVVGGLMFAYWIWRMVTLYPGEAPMAYRSKNVIELVRSLLSRIL